MGRIETVGNATLYLGDCRAILPTLSGIDAVVTDPPYGVTDHPWDKVVDPNVWMVSGSVAFAAEPFATRLINTAPQKFRYDLVWRKNTVSNMKNCKVQPGRNHERILVFGDLPYFAQRRRRTELELSRLNMDQRETMLFANPGSVLEFDAVNNRSSERTAHPCQKPLELMEWLILSYTAIGQRVLDPFMGSGSTGVACANLGRGFIGIDSDAIYFEAACERIAAAQAQPRLFA